MNSLSGGRERLEMADFGDRLASGAGGLFAIQTALADALQACRALGESFAEILVR